jgi:flagellar hook-associated protein 2
MPKKTLKDPLGSADHPGRNSRFSRVGVALAMSSSSHISLSGLASGVDTDSVVSQLMAIERQGQTRLQLQQSVSKVRQDALRDVSTRLKNLENAAKDLHSAGLWADTQSADSTDSSRVAITSVGPSGPGGYTIEVERLARAEQRTYDYSPPAADTSIAIGGTTFRVTAGTTLDSLVSSINAAANGPVYAAAVTDPTSGNEQLVLSSRTPGAAGSFSAVGDSISEDATKTRAGLDALFKVDGVERSASSNVVSNAIPGVQLTLKGTTPASSPVTVTVSAPAPDTEAIKAKLHTFVDQYNSTLDFLNRKVTEAQVPNAATEDDATKGVLHGDQSLRNIINRLRTSIYSFTAASNPAGARTLADIGISTGATTGSGELNQDAVAGKLTLDDKKLTDALTSNRDAVHALLGQTLGDGGFGRSLEAIVHPSTQAGGELDTRISRETSESSQISSQLQSMDQRLSLKEARLKRQFAAMESALAKSQSQGQWLSGQIASLSRSS